VLAASQIAKALRDHDGRIIAVVPHYAMSGGTLIRRCGRGTADHDPLGGELGNTMAVSRERIGPVLDAYAELALGNPEPLVSILDANVEWLEWIGAREARRLVGAEPVARLLRDCRLIERIESHSSFLAPAGEGTRALTA
jgi:hypothetical protein